MIFSDGSVCGGSVGCGACAAVLFPVSETDPVQVDTFAVGSRVGSLECEIQGVILGITMAIKYFESFQYLHSVQDVFIFSDCYCAIDNIARMKFNTRPDIYIKLQDLRHQLLKLSIHIQLVYVKAHTGITGNEMADQYSKEVAQKILKGDIPAPFTISISDAFRIASDIVTKSWQLHWDNHDKACYTYNLIPSVQTKVIFPTSREIGVSYCRLLLLHDSVLRDDSHRTGTSDSPLCESCSVNETAEHFFYIAVCTNKQEVT